MLPKCSVNHQKFLVDHLVNKPMWVLMSCTCSDGHVTKEISYIRCTPHHFFIICISTTMQVPLKKRKLTCIRHCKYTQRWCVGLLHDHEVKYLSEFKSISVPLVNELKSMVITGALPCLINTTDTGDIAFDLHMES